MCIFCKIVKKEVPASVVYEDSDIIAFKDVHPIAPVHILLIPKKHIESVDDLRDEDVSLAGKLVVAAGKIARDFDISPKGYKLLFRVGEWGGQEVPHLHLHLIGGAKLYEAIHPEEMSKEAR
ncbi:MAG: histidine triad nucleotide-binding protein [Candidatus Moranbacteria bacterium RIFOXYA12_FULL_44_15]|nr:MAG: histidine triad nucleotide-binding protein [Candidatus Moranbacteria bacterium RIFOXYA12_FULL_44_15]